MNSEPNNKNSYDSETEKKLQDLSRRSLNVATGGTWNRVRNAPVVGGLAKKGEEKIANKLANSRLSQKIINQQKQLKPTLGVQNKEEQTKASNPKSGDIGLRNLQTSLSNKVRNLWNSRKRKKTNSENNQEVGTNNINNASNLETKDVNISNFDNEETIGDNKDAFSLDSIFARRKKIIKIKLVVYLSIFLFIFLAFLLLISSAYNLISNNSEISIPIFNSSTYGTSQFVSTYEKGTNEYQNEIRYYEKLQEVSKNYFNAHGEELRTNYIHALLIYIYYQVDMDEVSEKGDIIPINYSKMTNMIDIVVNLMTSSSSKSINYEKNGEFYNNLKNSSEIKNYYQLLLKEKDMDAILSDVFELAKELDDITFKDDTVLTEETEITLPQTGDNSKTETISINEYLLRSIYANSPSLNSEIVKAYTIAYSTNIVASNKQLTINLNVASANNSLCNPKEGCSYDQNGNLVSGGGNQSSKNTIYYNGKYYYKTPLTDIEIANLNSVINSVFGNVLVNNDGTYPTLDMGKLNGLGDGAYQDILRNGFGNYSLKNIGENSYVLDGSYGTEKVLTSAVFYDQGNYASTIFCGKKKETIKTSGCGVTSMAIIVSTYENSRQYDPITMMNHAYKSGYCGGNIVGTATGFFKKEANTMKYKYLHASKYNKKDLNTVLKHLSQGHLVIAHMSPGHFTGGGHYIVLGGVDPTTKKVYVYDPNNKSNSSWRKTGNGWYSFNDIIVKETWGFYIIWKG